MISPCLLPAAVTYLYFSMATLFDPLALLSEAMATKSAAPLAKRRRLARPYDWRITIATPQTFKTFLVIIYRVLSQCPFQLFKSDAFTGVRVESMDSSMVCMIKASYECDIEVSPGVDLSTDGYFCVVTDTFNTLLKDVQAGHVLTLTRYSDAADLALESYARDESSNRSTATLTLIDEEYSGDRLRMQDIQYEYMVEMNLARLKSYCKMAGDINSSHMEFKIEVARVEDAPEEEGMQHLLFTVGASSDVATFAKTHHSTVALMPVSGDKESGDTGVKYTMQPVATGGEEEDAEVVATREVYNEVFSTTYLNLVLKSMDRQTVQLFMSPARPLVVKYSLGNDLSHVQVILAARARDE